MTKSDPLVGSQSDHLFYVRLMTPLGGLQARFREPTLNSATPRLSELGDEAQINAVLGFLHMSDARFTDQALHAHFWRGATVPRPEEDMSFLGNGQSKLYSEDTLGVDGHYTQAQAAAYNGTALQPSSGRRDALLRVRPFSTEAKSALMYKCTGFKRQGPAQFVFEVSPCR